MEEKERKTEERKDQTKLTWEAPKLYALDKGKTEGGTGTEPTESGFYFS
ncbi:MAG: hypothetical protein SVU94_08750 [Bacteroidota bacterium]|nr:hypothetical protein [Bacteroidota bacterium]